MPQRRVPTFELWASLFLLATACESDPDSSVTSGGSAGVAGALGGSDASGGVKAFGGGPTGGVSGTAPMASAGEASNLAGSSGSNTGIAGEGTGGTASGASDAGGTAAGGGGSAGTASSGVAGTSSSDCEPCSVHGEPVLTGETRAPLDALSGLALSRQQPNILFAHNDHDGSVVFALDLEGNEHARISLTDAPVRDLEDVAVGPCGAQTCVFLADIGDNNAVRSEYAILRFVAPMVPNSPGSMTITAEFERFRFVYEDGSHNAEGLMVGPDGTIYIATKLAPGTGGRVEAMGPSSIYRLPSTLATEIVAEATKVATLSVPADGDLAASAAAAHPCGRGFLLRTYDRVYEFVTPEGMPFEAAFTAVPSSVAMPDEPQSEGIDYAPDGRGFITAGEGVGAPILQTRCEQF
ncbi:MAG TPA: hypothetical protein VIM73_04950 [Polyangiaceae bacterium]